MAWQATHARTHPHTDSSEQRGGESKFPWQLQRAEPKLGRGCPTSTFPTKPVSPAVYSPLRQLYSLHAQPSEIPQSSESGLAEPPAVQESAARDLKPPSRTPHSPLWLPKLLSRQRAPGACSFQLRPALLLQLLQRGLRLLRDCSSGGSVGAQTILPGFRDASLQPLHHNHPSPPHPRRLFL